MNEPILFIFSGLPGTGKSSLGKLLAKEYNAVYLRIDTIEQGLRDLCHCDVLGEGYRLAYRIAADNLKLELSVVADSCNPIELTRKEWEEVAKNCSCRFINIEVVCSDEEEHRQRIETRESDVAGLQLPTWEQIKNREYDSWETKYIRIDTAHRTVEESFKELQDMFIRQKHNKSGSIGVRII